MGAHDCGDVVQVGCTNEEELLNPTGVWMRAHLRCKEAHFESLGGACIRHEVSAVDVGA